jgi:hypothetical protein
VHVKEHTINMPILVMTMMLIVIVIGHAWFWARANYNATEFDLQTCWHFVEQATKLVSPNDKITVPPRPIPGKFEASLGLQFLRQESFCRVQIVITFFFTLVGFLILLYG